MPRKVVEIITCSTCEQEVSEVTVAQLDMGGACYVYDLCKSCLAAPNSVAAQFVAAGFSEKPAPKLRGKYKTGEARAAEQALMAALGEGTVCGRDGCEFRFKGQQGAAQHLRHKHGVTA